MITKLRTKKIEPYISFFNKATNIWLCSPRFAWRSGPGFVAVIAKCDALRKHAEHGYKRLFLILEIRLVVEYSGTKGI